MRKLTFLILLLLTISAKAQITTHDVIFVASAPTGTSCTLNRLYIVRSSGAQYMNILGSCTKVRIDLSNGITGDLPFANLTQGSALSVLGVTGNATADVASIAAASDFQVFRRSGTSVGFGAVNLASSNAVTGALPAVNGGTGQDTSASTGVPYISSGTWAAGTAMKFDGTQLALGFGATTPPSGPLFSVASTINTSPRGIASMQFSTDTSGARLGFFKARGTVAAPTTVVTGDTLGRLMFRGYDGTNYLEMGSIESISTGTIAATRIPTQLVFSTATNAAPSVLTTALTLGSDQSATFAGHVTVEGVTSTGATGTGNFAFSISPTFTGTVGAPTISAGGTSDLTLRSGSTPNKTFIADASVNQALFSRSGIAIGASSQYLFTNTGNEANTTVDTGIARNAAGVVEVNNGSAGTLRDFIARNHSVSATQSGSNPAPTANSGTGITLNAGGEFRDTIQKLTFTQGAFSAGATTADATITTLQAKQLITGIWADVTQVFSGGAVATATMTCGKTAGGAEYLVSFNILSATIRRGLVDGDLGTSINRANAVQGGDMPSFTATTAVQCRITTTGANTSALTQGSVTFYVATRSLP